MATNIRVNGNELTEAQILTLRTALNTFAIDLKEESLGADMSRQYAVHVNSIQTLFGMDDGNGIKKAYPEMTKRGYFDGGEDHEISEEDETGNETKRTDGTRSESIVFRGVYQI